MLNEDKLKEIGKRMRVEAMKLHPEFGDWSIFSKSFGFFQWKKKNQLTPEQIGFFKEGWGK